GYSCQAANLLNEIMDHFNADDMQEKIKKMHYIEQSGDEARHAIVEKLAKEFITHIEREDIMAIIEQIDNVTDTIEDVLVRMYMCNVKKPREHALKFTEIIVKCCNSQKQALEEFQNFRKSRTLHELIIEINRLEEVGDKLFTEAIRDLYLTCDDFKEIVAWDHIYDYMEKCCDNCEEVANLIENVKMKNS
ncbi:MAG: DUF47 family protein, partial [Erysipelotrichia bacterium]|nr:DUF47 family protein [Erysipelotrichia bacterium]